MRFFEKGGEKMPTLGYGTFRLPGSECENGVRVAIETGYRHIDTARMYKNEKEVGKGIKDAGINRESLFVTSKIPPDHLTPEQIRKETENSLRELDMDYLNLLLIHWPNFDIPLEKSLETFFQLKEEGKIKAVGVSNFTIELTRRAAKVGEIFTNQVEYHPMLDQQKLLDVTRELDILLTAYSPIARGEVNENETIKKLAEKYNKTPTQVTLRWLIQQDKVAAIPKAAKEDHIKSNFDIFDFVLTGEEMREMDAVRSDHRLVDPAWAPDWD
jgi:2,5-diketo-D-gluconate reductase B